MAPTAERKQTSQEELKMEEDKSKEQLLKPREREKKRRYSSVMKEENFAQGQSEKPVLKDAIYKFLRQFYNENDTQKITEEFMKDFYRSISSLSLDDLERLATSYLQEEKSN
ncbi:hypothetical protein C0J52_04888 [Blattella germanica]|nr:hypothetical protein C0J52_04888 [Blattella germanica]